MVQIIPAGTPKKPTFMQRLNVGVGQGLEMGQQIMQNYQQENAAKKLGLDPEVMRGLDPQTRSQILGEALQQNIKVQRSGRTAGINYRPEQGGFGAAVAGGAGMTQGKGQSLQAGEPTERLSAPAPEQMIEPPIPNRKPPTPGAFPPHMAEPKPGEKPSKSQGMIPQEVLEEQKFPVLDPNQIQEEGRRIAAETRARGMDMTDQQGMEQTYYQNELTKEHNQGIDNQIATREQAQAKYAQVGENAISKVVKPEDLTDEMIAMAHQWGVEAASKHKSIPKIEHEVAKKAEEFKNELFRIGKSIGPDTITSTNKILGRERDSEDTKTMFRNKLKPLLDKGMYDTARKLMARLGYGPESIETIISDLGEGSKKSLIEFPDMNREKERKGLPRVTFKEGYARTEELQPMNNAQRSILSNNIRDVFQRDPAVNLILLRKAYADKGVDWREFSSILNKKMADGEIQLNPDQLNQMVYIDEPPRHNLDLILKKARLID